MENETRVAVMSIIVEDAEKKNSVEALNAILHEYSDFIIGRMGLPYKAKKINIIRRSSRCYIGVVRSYW